MTCSSMAERSAVNRMVSGSSPDRSAYIGLSFSGRTPAFEAEDGFSINSRPAIKMY